MTAADGKRYATDCFAQDDLLQGALTDRIDNREIFMKA